MTPSTIREPAKLQISPARRPRQSATPSGGFRLAQLDKGLGSCQRLLAAVRGFRYEQCHNDDHGDRRQSWHDDDSESGNSLATSVTRTRKLLPRRHRASASVTVRSYCHGPIMVTGLRAGGRPGQAGVPATDSARVSEPLSTPLVSLSDGLPKLRSNRDRASARDAALRLSSSRRITVRVSDLDAHRIIDSEARRRSLRLSRLTPSRVRRRRLDGELRAESEPAAAH